MESIDTLDKNKNYFIYCRSGNSSGKACEIMKNIGFKMFNLIGGMNEWTGKICKS